LVRARRELRLRQGVRDGETPSSDGADEKKIKLRDLRNLRLKYFHARDEHRQGEGLV
jgi:hypothetical protein